MIGKTADNTLFAPRTRTSGLLVTVLLSGVIGFCAGISREGKYRNNIESSQVLAGVVQHPADSPFGMYHAKQGTLLVQIPAALIWLGVSEGALSIGIGGFLGMLSFQAIALTTFALSSDALISVVSAVVIYVVQAFGFGIVYNIYMVDGGTFSIGGGSFALLVIALWGNGCVRLASFLLGLACAIHPTTGAWCLGVTGLGL